MKIAIPAALALALAAVPGATQTPQRPPVFRGAVDIVQLDVSVVDRSRQPVRGLTQADFTVLENGTPQRIVAFEAFDIEDPPPPPVAWMRDVAPDVATNSLAETRLFVLVIDDALIPMDPRMIRDAKQVVRGIIDKLGPNDLTAVVFTADNRRTQDFTNDRTKLLATVDAFLPGLATYRFPPPADTGPPALPTIGSSPPPDLNTDGYFFLSSINTLSRVADVLVDVPHRRKAVIWVSPGVPVDAADTAPRSIAAGASMSGQQIAHQLLDRTRDVMERAQRANVAIYSVDPTGLGGLEDYIARQNGESFPTGAISHRKAAMSLDFLEMAAAQTGGRAIVNTNDYGPGIEQIFRENSSYYLLGFQPANTRTDGTLRRLEVNVNRPDVEVRTRSGYYAASPGKPDARPPESAALAKAISGLLPAAGLPLQAALAPFAVPGQRHPTVTIALGVRQPVPDAAAQGRITEVTELLTSAFTPEGDARGSQRHTARITLRLGANGEAAYEILSRIDLAPGRYRLRLAAHNAGGVKSGSVFGDVEIPDFANAPLSVSGVILSAQPGRASAPREVLAPILPVVPTAERDFLVTERVTVFLRVYQSGRRAVAPVQLSITIRDARGGAPVSETQTLGLDRFIAPEAAPEPPTGRAVPRGGLPPRAAAPDAFANAGLRTADVRYPIPLASLGPGAHVLTVRVRLGEMSFERNVRFAVK